MNFKYYENSWIPKVKGVFFIVMGIFAFSKAGIFGNLLIFFDILIMLIAILYLVIGFLVKGVKYKPWLVAKGVFHMAFGVWLAFKYGGDAMGAIWVISLWVIFSMLADLVESVILFVERNVLGVMFVINAVCTAVLAHFTLALMNDNTPERLTQLGIIVIMVGLVTQCTAFVLGKSKVLPD